MKAESWHLPEYRCLAPSIRPIAGPHWLHTSHRRVRTTISVRGRTRTGRLWFDIMNLTVYIMTERNTPATHADT